MDKEGGGEANASQEQEIHMMNIYLTDSDKEANVDFVKDHELCAKTQEKFQDKARKYWFLEKKC